MLRPKTTARTAACVALRGGPLPTPLAPELVDSLDGLRPMNAAEQSAFRIERAIVRRANVGANKSITEVSESAVVHRDFIDYLNRLILEGFEIKHSIVRGNHLVLVSWAHVPGMGLLKHLGVFYDKDLLRVKY